MKKALGLAIVLLFVGLFCMFFVHENDTQEEKTAVSMGKEMAFNANEDSIKVVDQSNQVQTDLERINNELNSLEEEITVLNENCTASYYHNKFNGKKTASGVTFNNKGLTAAHRTLPFGTKVRVTNLENDESVIVTINDRGPFTKGKIIDLSKKAFMDITHNKGAGHLSVKIEVLPENYTEDYSELMELKESLVFSADSLNNNIFEL